MRKTILAAALAAMMMTACSKSETPKPEVPPVQDDAQSLVVYFSRVGNTEFPEDMDAVSSASLNLDDDGTLKGNAQMLAEWISDESGSGLVEILAEEPYPVDYDETVEQAKQEQNDKNRPVLKSLPQDPEQFDTIYLVFPNWWGDLPMPVYSFFDTYDLAGKNIYVFITHEGSRFSDTVETIQSLEPEASVYEGMDVSGGLVGDNEQTVREWVKQH